MTTAEKRRNRRLDCLVPVEGQKGSLFDLTRTVDFSRGGFGFITHQEIPINKEINVEIDLFDDDQSIIVVGKVKWVSQISGTDKYRIGLSFEDVKWGSKSRLNQYFRELIGRRSARRYH